MTEYGAIRERSGLCLGKDIRGEIRFGWQKWLEHFVETVDGFGNRNKPEWIAFAWADRYEPPCPPEETPLKTGGFKLRKGR